jgi:UDP-3-O-acyl-N-acetylglucosamine deacetylase
MFSRLLYLFGLIQAVVDDVTSTMKTAMKAKDTVTLNTVRLIRSAFANAAIELRTESLTDEQVCILDGLSCTPSCTYLENYGWRQSIVLGQRVRSPRSGRLASQLSYNVDSRHTWS